MIKIIAAISKNNAIGINNKLLWHLPKDLKRFKKLTLNSNVIMGRRTYESIGKALPNRKNIVISRNKNYKLDDAILANSINKAIELANKNCFIIGGEQIYKEAINIADEMYITHIDQNFIGDSFFPKIEKSWKIINREIILPDNEHKYKFEFIDYKRR